MWTTVLMLAIAVNLEPTRFVLVPLLLARDRPMLQLLAYLIGVITVNLGFGFLILFVFERNPLGTSASGGGKAQMAVGALALAIAAFMALRASLAQRKQPHSPGDVEHDVEHEPKRRRRIDKFADNVRKFLGRGRSPWLAGLLGTIIGIPSIDYLAVLLIIGTADRTAPEKAAALVAFVLVGSLVVMAPLIGYLISPVKTLERISRFSEWTRTRSQIEYAGLLAFVGLVLIGVGWSHL